MRSWYSPTPIASGMSGNPHRSGRLGDRHRGHAERKVRETRGAARRGDDLSERTAAGE